MVALSDAFARWIGSVNLNDPVLPHRLIQTVGDGNDGLALCGCLERMDDIGFLLISLICESENPVLPGSRAGKLLSVLHPLLMAFGIFWTGSRIIAALLLLFWLYFLIRKRAHRRKTFLLGAGIIAFIAVYLANVDHYTSLGRFREIFQVNASTMIRPAYWLDAVRALLTRPLGFGYEGFFISQGTIQSGPYYVRWLHNGFLECAYSFGWAAGIAIR
jgi:O-antigen ligase